MLPPEKNKTNFETFFMIILSSKPRKGAGRSFFVFNCLEDDLKEIFPDGVNRLRSIHTQARVRVLPGLIVDSPRAHARGTGPHKHPTGSTHPQLFLHQTGFHIRVQQDCQIGFEVICRKLKHPAQLFQIQSMPISW